MDSNTVPPADCQQITTLDLLRYLDSIMIPEKFTVSEIAVISRFIKRLTFGPKGVITDIFQQRYESSQSYVDALGIKGSANVRRTFGLLTERRIIKSTTISRKAHRSLHPDFVESVSHQIRISSDTYLKPHAMRISSDTQCVSHQIRSSIIEELDLEIKSPRLDGITRARDCGKEERPVSEEPKDPPIVRGDLIVDGKNKRTYQPSDLVEELRIWEAWFLDREKKVAFCEFKTHLRWAKNVVENQGMSYLRGIRKYSVWQMQQSRSHRAYTGPQTLMAWEMKFDSWEGKGKLLKEISASDRAEDCKNTPPRLETPSCGTEVLAVN